MPRTAFCLVFIVISWVNFGRLYCTVFGLRWYYNTAIIDLEIWTLGIDISDLAICCRFIPCRNRYFSPARLDHFWRLHWQFLQQFCTIESLCLIRHNFLQMGNQCLHDVLVDGVLDIHELHLVCLVAVMLLHVWLQLWKFYLTFGPGHVRLWLPTILIYNTDYNLGLRLP